MNSSNENNNIMNNNQPESSKKGMKIIAIILTIIGIAIIFISAISMFFKTEPKQEKPNNKEPIIKEPIKEKENYLATRYGIEKLDYSIFEDSYAFLGIAEKESDFQNIINTYQISFYENEKLSTKDYEKYKYLLIAVSYVECAEEITYNNIDIRKYKTIINFDSTLYCGLCAPVHTIFEIRIPKEKRISKNIKVKFNNTNDPECSGDVAYKPVLYLYPEKETKITVNFKNENLLTTTYPKFNKEWNVVANPNGDLYDSNGKYYYALFWEELEQNKTSFEEGFYVSKENAIQFLEEKLSILGLNAKEKNEFIMFWLPILEKNQHNLVYFELTENLQKDNTLIIEPQPDTLIRIRMHVKRINKETSIKEQILPVQKRTGYVAVEWGGTIN